MLSLDEIKNLVEDKLLSLGHQDRYSHTLGVVHMAEYLAEIYHIDITKAKTAAYLHDFCKYDTEEEIKKNLSEKDQEECLKYPVLYHSYGSAVFYRKNVGEDEDIYQAIRNHVFGRIGMSRLEEIILISDYTEENRTYPNCIHCREILLSGNLNQAIYESTLLTIEFLKKKNIIPHPLQLEVLKHYEGLCKNDIK
ncbi:MAG: bis(5'-nucleosyl)-tetraphosphatase (symmetrical) YqeK [Roseburia sp.]|nr:bis(5'-nucleosyl)-tetraphosphatase (symmetrical) YqeK [Anaeroplasma bactoclasticum]MCM1197016.1 bis(5'-nucleosyl)-tetraphosphatase (symmetrical) YqeK [Roseburia sp.]MCM1556675.1 bis(5'-nucleosyl)-tetraphosphatase (symmetrical) YqeK [Anaeroplasma bactoclasticum]